MASSLQFELLAPDRRLAQCEASQVELPGAEGDFTVLPDHMPLVSSLRPGIVRVRASGDENTEFVVTGGYVEISADSAIVLAEQAVERAHVTKEMLEQFTESAERDAAGREGPEKDLADKYLSDMVALERAIGAQA